MLCGLNFVGAFNEVNFICLINVINDPIWVGYER